MYFVYILRSLKNSKKTYVGFTRNIKRRLYFHNLGQSIYTNKFKPWKIETLLIFDSYSIAFKFKSYLKTSSGIAFMRKRLITKN